MVSTPLRPGRLGPGSRRPQSRRAPPNREGRERPHRCHPPSGGMRALRQSRIARDVDFAAVRPPVMGDIRGLNGGRTYPKLVPPALVRNDQSSPEIFRELILLKDEQLIVTVSCALQPLKVLFTAPEGLLAARVRSFSRCRVPRMSVPWAASQEPGSGRETVVGSR